MMQMNVALLLVYQEKSLDWRKTKCISKEDILMISKILEIQTDNKFKSKD